MDRDLMGPTTPTQGPGPKPRLVQQPPSGLVSILPPTGRPWSHVTGPCPTPQRPVASGACALWLSCWSPCRCTGRKDPTASGWVLAVHRAGAVFLQVFGSLRHLPPPAQMSLSGKLSWLHPQAQFSFPAPPQLSLSHTRSHTVFTKEPLWHIFGISVCLPNLRIMGLNTYLSEHRQTGTVSCKFVTFKLLL